MARPGRRALLATILVLASSSGVAVVPASPVAANALPGTQATIVIRGLGYGHGRGLSQFGSWGWATHPNTTLRKDWRGILDFYYGGGGRRVGVYPSDTATTKADDGVMSVRLTALDGLHTSVRAESAILSATWASGGSTGTTRYGTIVAVPRAGSLTYDVWTSATPNCALTTGDLTGMTRLASGVAGPVVVTSPNRNSPTAGSADLISVCEPVSGGHRMRYYRGSVRALRDADGAARTANFVIFGQYLRGVVPRESPASWGTDAGGAGMNALRAQAVAARSYALRQNRYSYAKSCDSQSCQVYGGAFLRAKNSSGAWVTNRLEQDTTNRAIADTAHHAVIGSDGLPASTEYTSSNGGRTAGGTFPAKEDAGDLYAASLHGKVTNHSWTRVLSQADIEAKYPAIGTFTSIDTIHDGLGGAWGGYAVRVEIRGSSGTVTRSGWDFRGDWGLHNPWYETSVIAAPGIIANPIGSVLYVGDSVSLGATDELADAVKTAYPNFTQISCQGRQMVGGACVPAITGAFNRDGLGVVNLMGSTALASHDIVVVKLGYNDSAAGFAQELSSMVAALKAKNVRRVVFVNMSAGRLASDTRYDAHNLALAQMRLAEPNLVRILNWYDETTAPARWRWFAARTATDIHLNSSGQAELAVFLRTELDALRAAGDLTPENMAPTVILPGTPVRNGARGYHVRKLQEAINIRLTATRTTYVVAGRRKSKVFVDGIYGAESVAAVIALQRKLGLRATGTTDRATWEAVFGVPATNHALLRTGGTGYPATRHADVVTVRAALGKVYRRNLGTSTTYDTTLASLVRRFQTENGLYVSGIVNGRVMRAILVAASRS